MRKREPGKTVAVWSSMSQRAWAARVRCGELSGAKVTCSSLSEAWMSPAVANSSCSTVRPSCSARAQRSQRRKQIALGLTGDDLEDVGEVFAFGVELDHGLLADVPHLRSSSTGSSILR